MSSSRLSVLVFGVLFAACSFDPALPTTARIACDERGLCPTGYVCRPRFRICVSEASPDREAPSLREASVAPAVARDGTAVRARVRYSERLAEAPVLRLVQGSRSAVLSLVSADEGAEPSYVFEHVVDGQDAEGAVSILADAVDVSGNEALGVAVGVFTVDRAGPRVLSAAFSAPRPGNDGGFLLVRAGEVLGVRVTLSEPVSSPGALALESACDGGAALLAGSNAAGLLDFGAGPPLGRHGCRYAVRLEGAVDLAGNVLAPGGVSLGLAYEVDDEAPECRNLRLLRSVDGGEERCSVVSRTPPFDAFSVQFDLDELPASLTARLAGAPLTGCGLSACAAAPDGGVACRCAVTVPAGLTEGDLAVAVTTGDSAGNTRTATVPLRVDLSAPAVIPSATRLAFVPAPGCPLQAVSALGAGDTARLFFATNEQASVVLSSAPEALPFTRDEDTGTTFAFSYVLADAGAPRTVPLALTVRLEDGVGNVGQVTLIDADAGLLRLDTEPPPPVTAATTAAVLFRRAPWGDESGVPRFEVLADAGVVAPGTVVRVLDGPSPDTATELGRVVADARGAFSALLQRADRRTVYLAALDDACNASAPVDVKQIEWVATLGQKVAGSLIENPHRYFTARAFRPSTHQPFGAEADDTSALSRPGGAALSSRAEATWAGRSSAWSAAGGDGPLLAYDSARDRVVSMGGRLAQGPTADVVELDGDYWLTATPADPQSDGDPAPRSYPSGAYDPVRQKFVLFGGFSAHGVELGDTWEWDGASWALRAVGGPPARDDAATAFDPRRGVVVMFGGCTSSGPVGDTWLWDGHAWRSVAGAAPPARCSGRMAYDALRDRLVLMGGADANGNLLQDTWTFDGATWTRVGTTLPAAMGRFASAFVWDGQVIVSQGGLDVNGNPTAATFTWNGSAWTALSLTGAPPLAFARSAALDTRRGRIVMAGGDDSSAQTWVLDRPAGTAWRLLAPAHPPELAGPTMAFDPTRQVSVLFGGQYSPHDSDRVVWEWNGTQFRRVAPDAGFPSAREYACMAFEPTLGVPVMVGGRAIGGGTLAAQTWAFDGGQWSRPVTGGPRPAAGGLVADTARRRTVAYGTLDSAGELIDAVTEFDGVSWTNRPFTNGPPLRDDGAFVFDSQRSRSLLFGGLDPLPRNDLWSWNGVAWTPLAPIGVKPEGRGGAARAYDPRRDRFVVFGGRGALGPLSDTWEFDGTRWRQDLSLVHPPEVAWPAVTFDSARNVLVFYGGQWDREHYDRGGWYRHELWEYGLRPGDLAGQVMRVSFLAAGAEPGSALEAVSTRFVAGGQGAADAGARLWVWERGAFLPDVTNGATVGAAAELSWSTTDGGALGRLFEGGRQELSFAVTPVSGSGAQPSEVSVDYAEVRVRYRRP